VCSYCARFRRQCRYSLDNAAAVATRASFSSVSLSRQCSAARMQLNVRQEEQSRLDQLEGKLDSVLNAMR